MTAEMTAERFEEEYAGRCGVSVAELRDRGHVVRPCQCEADCCQGWQMVSQETADEIDDPEKPWAR